MLKRTFALLVLFILLFNLVACTDSSVSNNSSVVYYYEEYEEKVITEKEEAVSSESASSKIETSEPKSSKPENTQNVTSKEDVKLIIKKIDGITYNLKFKENKSYERSDENKEKIYAEIYEDEKKQTTVWFQRGTGVILKYFPQNDEGIKKKISKKEAVKRAENFLGQYVELSEYKRASLNYYEDSNEYTIKYFVYINDYRTTQCVSVTLAGDGTVNSYLRNPVNAFKKVRVPKFDESPILAKLKEDIYFWESFNVGSYEISDKWLDVYNGKAVLVYSVTVKETFKQNSHQHESYYKAYYPVGLKDYSDIEGEVVYAAACL